MLPRIPVHKVEVLGNTSAKGAILCCLDKHKMDQALEVCKEVQVEDLSLNLEFNELFIQNISF